MPRCVEGTESVLIVWDPLSRHSSRPVFGIPLKEYSKQNQHQLNSCKDWPYAVAWPEGLRNISEFSRGFPERVRFAITQIEQGGRTFREERTVKEYITKRPQTFRAQGEIDVEALEQDYGTPFAKDVVNTWIAMLLAKKSIDPNHCEALIGTCDFYLCEEARNHCGPKNYMIGLGYKYCHRSYNGLYQKMESAQAKKWVLGTVQCLQREIHAGLNARAMSCSEIEDMAIGVHPECYVENGFCSMPFSDKAKIFSIVKGEIFRKETLTGASETLKLCTSR